MRSMVCDGFSAVSADWKTIWTRRRSSRLRCLSAGGSARPSNSIVPVLGGSNPATTRASVVLPEPDSPMTPIACPRLSSRSMSSRMVTAGLPPGPRGP
jgi:hypothetical protein